MGADERTEANSDAGSTGSPETEASSAATEAAGVTDAPAEETNTEAEVELSAEEAAQAEIAALKEKLIRTAADFDNFRKRTIRDLDDARRRSKETVVREILPVIDNLERAVQASEGATEIAPVLEGVRMVLSSFEETAKNMGLTKVSTAGERFDPAKHDAMGQVETDDVPPGTIINELVPGYMMSDRLLRPAMVSVARAAKTTMPTTAAAEEPLQEDESSSDAVENDTPASES